MANLSAEEIYRACRQAGFTPDQATTMTAIALAESGGNTHAHNPNGEDSRGLFQINCEAHEWARGLDLFDPVVNAQAAYRVSGGGADISRWTVTHRSKGARYLQFQDEAIAAATAFGDVNVQGNFAGVEGYRDIQPASFRDGAGTVFDFINSDPASVAVPPMTLMQGPVGGDGRPTLAEQFVQHALAQVGDPYIWGAEASPDDPDPDAFDCSELVQWAASRVGIDVGDVSYLQYVRLKEKGAVISVEQALRTPGALLFSFPFEPSAGNLPPKGHVAISLGDGRTVEARGRNYGVGEFDAGNRFQYAAVIPGLEAPATSLTPDLLDATAPIPGPPMQQFALLSALGGESGDQDADGLSDGIERLLGTDAANADSDGDGLSDSFELFTARTNPLAADSDLDGLADNFELALGRDAVTPDGPDGTGKKFELFLGGGPDADKDGVSDALEGALGLNASVADTDNDGLADGFELLNKLDPLKVDSDADGVLDPISLLLGPGGATTGGALPPPVPGSGLLDELASPTGSASPVPPVDTGDAVFSPIELSGGGGADEIDPLGS